MENLNQFEEKVRDILTEITDLYAPLKISAYKVTPTLPGPQKYRPDASLKIRWKGQEDAFIVEIKARTAPKFVQGAMQQLKQMATTKQNPLLIVPYLSPSIQEMLIQKDLSGMDLNGNYYIQTPKILAIRLDQKNQYPESTPIKKIFSGNSSLVGRLLLRKKKNFSSLSEVEQALTQYGGQLSLSAISKVVKGLEEELIIQRTGKQIKLIQAKKLLDKLRDNYRPPKLRDSLRLKVPEKPLTFLRKSLSKTPWVLSGESSAEKYSITTPASSFSAYVEDLKGLKQYQEERFFNLSLKKTYDSFVYFDKQKSGWSSKLQCYLELSQLDKRERELSQSIEEDILKEFA